MVIFLWSSGRNRWIGGDGGDKASGQLGATMDSTDSELVLRAVCNAHCDRTHAPRWIHVQTALGVGFDTAERLCARFGLDPNEVVGGEEAEE